MKACITKKNEEENAEKNGNDNEVRAELISLIVV